MTSSAERRSPRIQLRVPLEIYDECHHLACDAQTAVVNEHGALVLCPHHFPEGEVLQVQNRESGSTARFKVVWYGGEDFPGRHKLGIEMIDERDGYWGLEYYAAARTKRV